MNLQRANRRLPVLTLTVVLCSFGRLSHAQLFERATLIKNARIITMEGPAIERGDILIKGKHVQNLGPSIELPFADRLTAKSVEASGKTVTPGFVDAWSGLGRTGAVRQPDATANAFDAFDGYGDDAFQDAFQNGLTTLFLAPAGMPGIKGTGTVLSLARNDDGSFGRQIVRESALCLDFGSEQSAVARLKTYQDARKKFRAAVEYRKSLESYEEELKEYIEKLEKRRKEKEKDKPKDEAAGKKESEPKPDEREKKPEPDPKPERDGSKAAVPFTLNPDPLAKKEEPAADSPKKPDGEKKKEDELKKPTKPKVDPAGEVLLRAVDHKLLVRIEAHRSADILNALALAEEFNLDIIIEGGADAYLVADQIAAADVPVILGQTIRTGLPESNEFRRHTPQNAALLGKAGVRCAVGSGGEPDAARFLAVNAQLANITTGLGPENDDSAAWLSSVTSTAADILGMPHGGRLRKGGPADLVIWSGDPSDPASRVEQVMIAGQVVYPEEN